MVLSRAQCARDSYPSDAQQRAFLAAYAAGEGGEGAAAVPATQLDALVVEANVFSLASHLYWSIWALIQAKCVRC